MKKGMECEEEGESRGEGGLIMVAVLGSDG